VQKDLFCAVCFDKPILTHQQSAHLNVNTKARVPIVSQTRQIDIFIRGIPRQASNEEVNAKLNPHLYRYNIQQFQCYKPKNKGYAKLYINDLAQGQAFLAEYTTRTDVRLSYKFHFTFELSTRQDAGASLRDEKFREQRVPPADTPLELAFSGKSNSILTYLSHESADECCLAMSIQNSSTHKFDATTVSCGHWSYDNAAPVFVSYYTAPGLNTGILLFGKSSAVLLLYPQYNKDEWVRRIDFAWNSIDTIFTIGGRDPSLVITCHYAPKFYRQEERSSASTLLSNLDRREQRRKKIRIPSLDEKHKETVACCFSYEIILSNNRALHNIRRLLKEGAEKPSTMHLNLRTVKPSQCFGQQLAALEDALSADCKGKMPFIVRFQIQKLALNGKLPPATVLSLIPIVSSLMLTGTSPTACAHALKQLYHKLAPLGPGSRAEEFGKAALNQRLNILSSSYLDEESVYRSAKKHRNLALVHHIRVTPAGIYLEGPEQ
jgi:hypothetical protein